MKYWEDNTWRKPVVTRAWHTFAREQHFKFIKSAKGQKMVADKLRFQKNRCYYCDLLLVDKDGKKIINYQADHIKPIWKAGMSKFTNYCITCPACNKLKGANVPNQDEVTKKRLYLKHNR